MTTFGSELQTHWDWRAAANFMCGGTGSALVMIMTIFALPDSPPSILGAIAVVLIGFGLLMVWLEIGRPWRFLHVFFHPQTSWMSREASVAVVLLPIALLGVSLKSQMLLGIAALFGLVFLYCQGRILKAARGIPAWREPAIVPLLMSTGLLEATALTLMILHLSGRAQNWMIFVFLLLVVARLWVWLAYRDGLMRAAAPPQCLRVVAKLHREFIIVGAILPGLFAVLPALGTFKWGLYLACLCALGAGWWLKFTLVVRAAYKQGYGIGKLRKGRPQIKSPVRRAGDPIQF